MTNPVDTSEQPRNVAVRAKVIDTLSGALTSAMREKFWGTLTLSLPFEDGIAQRGMVKVEETTPIM